MKLRAGKFYVECDVRKQDNDLYFFFPYNLPLLNEIRNLEKRKWHPDRTCWSAPITARNIWTLNYLAKDYPNPYEPFNKELELIDFGIEGLWDQQVLMASSLVQTHRALWAADPRTGKTWAAVVALEHMNIDYVWWVATRSAIAGVTKEFRLRKPKFKCDLITYPELVKRVNNWSGDAPPAVVFDECHALKTQDTQRTSAATYLARGMIEDHHDPVILSMSGTPNPKSPSDWWSQCEVVCPGFIQEGHPVAFQRRLSLVQKRIGREGVEYPHRVTYWDNVNKCGICGELKQCNFDDFEEHIKIKSVNEVAKLYVRLKGLVTRVNKKDCMDLPPIETIFYSGTGLEPEPKLNITKDNQIVDPRLIPNEALLRAVSTIKKVAPSAAVAYTLLRELSDGFQYKEVEDGKKKCTECKGTGKAWTHIKNERSFTTCFKCQGTLQVIKYKRIQNRVYCPKDDILKEVLDEHSEQGRLVVYAAFTASVDRVVDICLENDWNIIRVDGRGWHYFGKYTFSNDADALDAFDNFDFEKLCFVAQAESGSEGISLSASPTIFNYSNVFKWDKKYQSSERINDSNQKAPCGRIIELMYLDTDLAVYRNLMMKKELEEMTLGDLEHGQ